MNYLPTKLQTVLTAKSANAFLLFLTGFFFIQTILVSALHTIHPFGGWVTSLGTFTTRSIVITVLFILALCLIALWKSTKTIKTSHKELSVPDFMFVSA